MILPERVFGRVSVNRISSGFAIGLNCSPTQPRSFANERLVVAGGPRPFETTNANTDSPLTSSGRPMTAASATAGWETAAFSISSVPSRWPATLMTSSMRPRIQK